MIIIPILFLAVYYYTCGKAHFANCFEKNKHKKDMQNCVWCMKKSSKYTNKCCGNFCDCIDAVCG